ncbi:protein of unknown function [Tepidibacter aestuarii]|nr:protein of unknown function [Tepidibacter aestuarii]
MLIRFLHLNSLYPYLKKIHNMTKSRINHIKNIIRAIKKFSGGYIKQKVNSQAKLREIAKNGIPYVLSLKLLAIIKM